MPEAEPLPPLSEAQLEIMNVVWDRGEVTVADVWKALASEVSVRPVSSTATAAVSQRATGPRVVAQ